MAFHYNFASLISASSVIEGTEPSLSPRLRRGGAEPPLRNRGLIQEQLAEYGRIKLKSNVYISKLIIQQAQTLRSCTSSQVRRTSFGMNTIYLQETEPQAAQKEAEEVDDNEASAPRVQESALRRRNANNVRPRRSSRRAPESPDGFQSINGLQRSGLRPSLPQDICEYKIAQELPMPACLSSIGRKLTR